MNGVPAGPFRVSIDKKNPVQRTLAHDSNMYRFDKIYVHQKRSAIETHRFDTYN